MIIRLHTTDLFILSIKVYGEIKLFIKVVKKCDAMIAGWFSRGMRSEKEMKGVWQLKVKEHEERSYYIVWLKV